MTLPPSPAVLLLGTTERAGLAVTRSLGRRGIAVDVVRTGKFSAGEKSCYVGQVHVCGDIFLDAEGFADRLQALVQQKKYDLLIPIDDAACEICVRYRARLQGAVRLAVAEDAAYGFAHDKERLVQLCQELGIAAPATAAIRGRDDLARAAGEIGFPAYAKPAVSAVILNNRMRCFKGRLVRNMGELDEFHRDQGDAVPLLLQKIAPGAGLGVHAFCHAGEIISSVAQLRLHEPEGGGGGSYRMTVPMPAVLDKCTRLLARRINWSGVVMFEFKGTPAGGGYSIMEINGRFWGSLPLTISAGLDMPWWLYVSSMGAGRPGTDVAAQINVYQRYLKKDLGWMLRQLPHGGGGRVCWDWLKGLGPVVMGQEKLDLEDRRDPWPAVHDWLSPLADFSRKIRRRLFILRQASGQWLGARQRLAGIRRRLDASKPRVLFVCKGNICRSPFAQHYAQQRWTGALWRSAGTLPLEGRLVPVEAEALAALHFDLDLKTHRSASVDRELLAWADVIIAMDYANLGDLRRLGADLQRTVLLGEFDDGGAVADPYGQTPEDFSRAFSRIARAIDGLHLNGR